MSNEAPRMVDANFLAAATRRSWRNVLTMMRWCIARTSPEMLESFSQRSVWIFSSGWALDSQAWNAAEWTFSDRLAKAAGNFSIRASTANEESSALPSSWKSNRRGLWWIPYHRNQFFSLFLDPGSAFGSADSCHSDNQNSELSLLLSCCDKYYSWFCKKKLDSYRTWTKDLDLLLDPVQLLYFLKVSLVSFIWKALFNLV